MSRQLNLHILPGHYAIARLSPDQPFPAWADGPGFVSISRSEDELSIVCLQARIPAGQQRSPDWACLKLAGPFAFDETGIIAAVINPLSAAGLGVFVVSTYDGDHLLLKQADMVQARNLLTTAGHTLTAHAANVATKSCG